MIEGGTRRNNNHNPELSIITVVYNDEKFLERTIKSIISQNFDNYEFIIIDGGSTDKTLEIIKRYDKFIDYWISEKDAGIYDAMNKGIKYSKGEWLNFMNSSDIYAETNIVQKIFSNKIDANVKFIYSDWFICDAINTPNKKQFKNGSWEQGDILHQSVFYRRSLHDKYGLYLLTRDKFISDYFFFSLIEPECVMKINFPISINDISGISYGSWSQEQKVIVDYLMKKNNLTKLIFKIITITLKKYIKLLINIFYKI